MHSLHDNKDKALRGGVAGAEVVDNVAAGRELQYLRQLWSGALTDQKERSNEQRKCRDV